jgi:hypothetical protein
MLFNYKNISIAIFLLFLSACVGTDYIDDPIVKERLTISPRINTLAIGQEQIFSARYNNQYGAIENKQITWLSTAPNNISITPDGKAKALTNLATAIVARVGLTVDTLWVNRNSATDTTFRRSGTFQRVSSSYDAVGGVQIFTVGNTSKIVTDINFSTSAGPSLYLLLANHTSGRYTVTQGGNAINTVSVQITPNRMTQFAGKLTFDVPNSINPADYEYIVLYCTLGPVFGFAQLR